MAKQSKTMTLKPEQVIDLGTQQCLLMYDVWWSLCDIRAGTLLENCFAVLRLTSTIKKWILTCHCRCRIYCPDEQEIGDTEYYHLTKKSFLHFLPFPLMSQPTVGRQDSGQRSAGSQWVLRTSPQETQDEVLIGSDCMTLIWMSWLLSESSLIAFGMLSKCSVWSLT